MTTHKLPIVLFNTFKNKWIGWRIDVDNYPQGSIYQCVDLIRNYAEYAKYPRITVHGDAIDLWSYWLGDWYTRVNNSLTNKPPVGAIVFWKQWQYGHVAIAGRSNLLWVEVLEQNGWSGNGDGKWRNAIRIRKDFYHNCLGWMIHKK